MKRNEFLATFYEIRWMIVGFLWIPVLPASPYIYNAKTIYNNKDDYEKATFVIEYIYNARNEWGLEGTIEGKNERLNLSMHQYKKKEYERQWYKPDQFISVLINKSFSSYKLRVIPEPFDFDELNDRWFFCLMLFCALPFSLMLLTLYIAQQIKKSDTILY